MVGYAKLFALLAMVAFFSTIAGATQISEEQELNTQPLRLAWAETSAYLTEREYCTPHCPTDSSDDWHWYLAANQGAVVAIDAPNFLSVAARQLQAEGGVVLATLQAANIQVRGQWRVSDESNSFTIVAQNSGQLGVLMLTTDLPGIKVVTVEVRDLFSDLNLAYEDLVVTALITVQIGGDAPRLLSFTPATVDIGMHEGVPGKVSLVNYDSALHGCDSVPYAPSFLDNNQQNIFGFPEWITNYDGPYNLDIKNGIYSFTINAPTMLASYAFSITAQVNCYSPDFILLTLSFTGGYTLEVVEIPLSFANAPTDFVAAPAGRIAEVHDLEARGSFPDFTFTLIGGGQYLNADGNTLFSLGEKDGRLSVNMGVEQAELYRAPYVLTVELSDDRPDENGGRQVIATTLSVVLMTVLTVRGLQGGFIYATGGQARTVQANEDFALLPKINHGATLIIPAGNKISVHSESFVFVLDPDFSGKLIFINGSSLLGLVTSISDEVEGLTAYYGKESTLEGEQGVIYEIPAGTQFEKLNDTPLFQCIDFTELGIPELHYACGVTGDQAQIPDSRSRQRAVANAEIVPLVEEPNNSLRVDFVSKRLINPKLLTEGPKNYHFLVTRGALELPRLLTNYLNMPAYDTGRWLLYDVDDNTDILTVTPGPQVPPFAKLTIHAHQDIVTTVVAENVQTQIGWAVVANTNFVVGEFDGVVQGITESPLPSGLTTLTVQVTDQFSVLREDRYTNYLATGQITVFVWEPLMQSAPPVVEVPHLFAGVLATLTADGGDGQYTYQTSATDFTLSSSGAEVVLSVLTPQDGFSQHIITVVLHDGAGSRSVATTVTVIFRLPVSLAAIESITVASEYVGVVTTLTVSLEGAGYTYSQIGSSPHFGIGADGVISLTAGVIGESILLLTAQVQANTEPPSFSAVTVAVKVLPPLILATPSQITVAHLYTGVLATLMATGGNGVAASYSYTINNTLFTLAESGEIATLLLTVAQNGAAQLTVSVVLRDTIGSPPDSVVVTVDILSPVSLLPLSPLTVLHHAFVGAVATLSATGAGGNYNYDVVGVSSHFSVGNDGVVRISTAVDAAATLSLTVQVLANTQPPSADMVSFVITVLPPLRLFAPSSILTLSHQQIGSVGVFTALGGDGIYSYTSTENDKFALSQGAPLAVLSLVAPQAGAAVLTVTVTVHDIIGSTPQQAAATVMILSPLSLSLAVAGHIHHQYLGTVAQITGQGGYRDYGYSLLSAGAVFTIDEATGIISITQAVAGLTTLSVTVRVVDKPLLPALPSEIITTLAITVLTPIVFGEAPANLTVVANYWESLTLLTAHGGDGDIILEISGDDSFYLTNGTLSYGTLGATLAGDDESARQITLIIVADDVGVALPETVTIAVGVSAQLEASFAPRVESPKQYVGPLGNTQTSGGFPPYTYQLVDDLTSGDGFLFRHVHYLTVAMMSGELLVIQSFNNLGVIEEFEIDVKWLVNDRDPRTPEVTVTTVIEVVDGLVFRSVGGDQREITAQVSGHPQRTGPLALFTLFVLGADDTVSYAPPTFIPSEVEDAFVVLQNGAGVTVSLTTYVQEPQQLSIIITVSAQANSKDVMNSQLLQILVVPPSLVRLPLPPMMTLYDGGENCCLVAATLMGESGLLPYSYTLFADSSQLTLVAKENSAILSLQAKPEAATLTVSVAVFDDYQPPRWATVTALVTVLSPLTLNVPTTVRVLRNDMMELIATLQGRGGDGQYTYQILHLPNDRYRVTDEDKLSVQLLGADSYIVTVVLMDKIGSTPVMKTIPVSVFAPLTATAEPEIARVYSGHLGMVATVRADGGDGQYRYLANSDKFALSYNNGIAVLSLTVKYTEAATLTVAVTVADMVGSQEDTATVWAIILAPVSFTPLQVLGAVNNQFVGAVVTLSATGGDGGTVYPYQYHEIGESPYFQLSASAVILSITAQFSSEVVLSLTVQVSVASPPPSADLTIIAVTVFAPLVLSAPDLITVAHRYIGAVATLTAAGGEGSGDSYLYTVGGNHAAIEGRSDMATLSLISALSGATVLTLMATLSDTVGNAPVAALITVSVLPPLALPLPATLTLSYLQTGVLLTLEASGGRPPYSYLVSDDDFTVSATDDGYVLSVVIVQTDTQQRTLTITMDDAIASPAITEAMVLEIQPPVMASLSVRTLIPSQYTLEIGRVVATVGTGDYYYSLLGSVSLFAIDSEHGIISLTTEIVGATTLSLTVRVQDSATPPSAVTLMATVTMLSPLSLALAAPAILKIPYQETLLLATLTATGGNGEYLYEWLNVDSFTLIIEPRSRAVISLASLEDGPHTLTVILRDTIASPADMMVITITVSPKLRLANVILPIQNSVYLADEPQRHYTGVTLQASGGSGNYTYFINSTVLFTVNHETGEFFVVANRGGPAVMTLTAWVHDSPPRGMATQATADVRVEIRPPLTATGEVYPLFSGVTDSVGQIETLGAWDGRNYFSLTENPNNAFTVQADGLLLLTLAQPVTVLSPVVLVSNGYETVEVSISALVQPELGGGNLYEDGEMLIIGGYQYGPDNARVLSDEVWASSNGENWELRTAEAEFGPRAGAVAVQYKGRVWLLGGEKTDGPARDIWSSSDGGKTWRQDRINVPFDVGHTEEWLGAAWVAYNGKLWYFSVAGEVWNTDNGIDWTEVTQAADADERYPQRPDGRYWAEAFGARILLLAADGGDADVWSSGDGVHWTRNDIITGWPPRDGTAIAVSRDTAEALSYNEKMFIMRGGGFNEIDSVWSSSNGGLEWALASEMPAVVPMAGRGFAGFVFYAGRLYVAGGVRSNGELLGDVWESSTEGSNWGLASRDLSPRSHHAMVVAKRLKLPEFGGLQLGDVYIVGGINTPREVHRYRNDKWERMADFPIDAKHVKMAYYGDALYVLAAENQFGVSKLYHTRHPEQEQGWVRDDDPNRTDKINYLAVYDNKLTSVEDGILYLFDGEWSTESYVSPDTNEDGTPDFTGDGIDLVSHRGLLYALGGVQSKGDVINYIDHVWRSADAANWTRINGPNGFPRREGYFVSDNEYIYLIGGHAGTYGKYTLPGYVSQLVLRSEDGIHWVTLFSPLEGKVPPYASNSEVGGEQFQSALAVGADGAIYLVGGDAVIPDIWSSLDQGETWQSVGDPWNLTTDFSSNYGAGAAAVVNFNTTIPYVFITDGVDLEMPSGLSGDYPLLTMRAVGGNQQYYSWSITDDPYQMFAIDEESGVIVATAEIIGPVPYHGGFFTVMIRADSDLYSDTYGLPVRMLPPESLQGRFSVVQSVFMAPESGVVGTLRWTSGAWGSAPQYNAYSLVGNPQGLFALEDNVLILTVTGMVGAYSPVVRLANGGQFVDFVVDVMVRPVDSAEDDTAQGDIFIIGGYADGEYLNDVWRGGDNTEWTLLSVTGNVMLGRKGSEAVYHQERLYLLGGSIDGIDGLGGDEVWSSGDGINWRAEPNMPAVRHYHTAVSHQGKLVVFGGYVGTTLTMQPPAVWAFDGHTWSTLNANSFHGDIGRYAFGGVSHRGLLYASGGQSINSFIAGTEPHYYNDVWVSYNGGEDWFSTDGDSKFIGGRGVMVKAKIDESGPVNLYQIRSGGSEQVTIWSSLHGVEWRVRIRSVGDFSEERGDGGSDGREPWYFSHGNLRNLIAQRNADRISTKVPLRTQYHMVAVPYVDAPGPLNLEVRHNNIPLEEGWLVVDKSHRATLRVRAWGGAGEYTYSVPPHHQHQNLFSINSFSFDGKMVLEPRDIDSLYITVRVASGGQIKEEVIYISDDDQAVSLTLPGAIQVGANHGGQPFYQVQPSHGFLPYTYKLFPVPRDSGNFVRITPAGELYIPLVDVAHGYTRTVEVRVVDASGNRSTYEKTTINVTDPLVWEKVPPTIDEVIPYDKYTVLWNVGRAGVNRIAAPSGGQKPYTFLFAVHDDYRNLIRKNQVDQQSSQILKGIGNGNIYRQQVMVTLGWVDATGGRVEVVRNIVVGGRLSLAWATDKQVIHNRYVGVIGTLSLQPTNHSVTAMINYLSSDYDFNIDQNGVLRANPAPLGPSTVFLQVWAEGEMVSSAPRTLTIIVDAPFQVFSSAAHFLPSEANLPQAVMGEILSSPINPEEPSKPIRVWSPRFGYRGVEVGREVGHDAAHLGVLGYG